MNKPVYNYFEKDHRRIEKILEQALKNPGIIDEERYAEFRTGLLKHIKMEEKTLFPAAQKANNGKPIPLAATLRLEHGALTALMVPPPTLALIKVLKTVMEKHDNREEEPGGMYDICEALTQSQTQELLTQLSQVKEVPVHPANKAGFALEAAKRALKRAGYDYDELTKD